MPENNQTPFYQKNWFIILMLIFIFPIGLYLMWAYTSWGKVSKIVVTVIIAIIAIPALFSEAEEDTTAEEEPEEEVAQKEEEETEDNDESEAPAEESTDEEVTEEESEDETEISEDIEHEVIEDVDVYTYTETSDWSLSSQMRDFSIAGTDKLVEEHEDINNGAVLRTIAPVQDDKGNENLIYVAQVYYSQETIEEINYDNWPDIVSEDLYNAADSVMIYTPLNDDTDIENKSYDNLEELPEFYMGTIGAEYEKSDEES